MSIVGAIFIKRHTVYETEAKYTVHDHQKYNKRHVVTVHNGVPQRTEKGPLNILHCKVLNFKFNKTVISLLKR